MLHNHTLALFLWGIPRENGSHIASRQYICLQSGFKDVHRYSEQHVTCTCEMYSCTCALRLYLHISNGFCYPYY